MADTMESTELRIGSWVNYNGENQRVISIDGNLSCLPDSNKNIMAFENWAVLRTTLYTNHKPFIWIGQLKPIKITEAMLLTFKFHKDNYGVFEKTKDNTNTARSEIELWIKKCKHKNKWVWGISVGQDFGTVAHVCFIKYIHQLQNIYHAITGKELVVK